MANENMKNPFRLLLNILHRLLDDKADTEYVDRKIDEVCKDVSLGVSEAVVGQTVQITEVDENGKPVKWEAVEMASGGASSWNDLTDKPFDAVEIKLDIIPEQQVTFSDGVARLTSWKDPCYDLGLVSDPGTMTAILEINGETIESELEYYYEATGTFGAYTVNLGDKTITLGEGATVQDGETVTIRLYAITNDVKKIDEMYLPNSVQYDVEQSLTANQKRIARENIGAVWNGDMLRDVLLDEEVKIPPADEGSYFVLGGLFFPNYYDFIVVSIREEQYSYNFTTHIIAPIDAGYNAQSHCIIHTIFDKKKTADIWLDRDGETAEKRDLFRLRIRDREVSTECDESGYLYVCKIVGYRFNI